MTFHIPITLIIEAESAEQLKKVLACYPDDDNFVPLQRIINLFDCVENLNPNNYDLGDIECTKPDEPTISPELVIFMKTEVDDNEDDRSGSETDLDYIHSSLLQMPDDVIVNQAGYFDNNYDDEIFASRLTEEFEELLKKYGGATKVTTLIN